VPADLGDLGSSDARRLRIASARVARLGRQCEVAGRHRWTTRMAVQHSEPAVGGLHSDPWKRSERACYRACSARRGPASTSKSSGDSIPPMWDGDSIEAPISVPEPRRSYGIRQRRSLGEVCRHNSRVRAPWPIQSGSTWGRADGKRGACWQWAGDRAHARSPAFPRGSAAR
jgi:hypothetical protein